MHFVQSGQEMKKVILSVVIAAVMVPVFAQTKKEPEEIACAIMKDHKVKIAKATKSKMFTDYKGRRYFFCCAGCPGQFKDNPEKFKDAPSIPTPKAK